MGATSEVDSQSSGNIQVTNSGVPPEVVLRRQIGSSLRSRPLSAPLMSEQMKVVSVELDKHPLFYQTCLIPPELPPKPNRSDILRACCSSMVDVRGGPTSGLLPPTSPLMVSSHSPSTSTVKLRNRSSHIRSVSIDVNIDDVTKGDNVPQPTRARSPTSTESTTAHSAPPPRGNSPTLFLETGRVQELRSMFEVCAASPSRAVIPDEVSTPFARRRSVVEGLATPLECSDSVAQWAPSKIGDASLKVTQAAEKERPQRAIRRRRRGHAGRDGPESESRASNISSTSSDSGVDVRILLCPQSGSGTNSPVTVDDEDVCSSNSSDGGYLDEGIGDDRASAENLSAETSRTSYATELSRRLSTLQKQEKSVLDQMASNEKVQATLESIVVSVLQPHELSRYETFMSKHNDVINLLLSLAQRQRRYERILEDSKRSASDLEDKREKLAPLIERLREQHEEANAIKLGNDAQAIRIAETLERRCCPSEAGLFLKYVSAKPQLAFAAHDIREKIELAVERLKALGRSPTLLG